MTISSELFDSSPKLAATIQRNGLGWLRRQRRMVESWGEDLGLDAEQLRAAIDADLARPPAPADPDRFAGRCVAITSLNPNPVRRERQQLCLQSWRSIGLPVIAVNTAAEIADFRFEISDLKYESCDDVATDYDRPTQRVSTLIDVGRRTGLPFLVINSDIEISGDPQVITDAIACDADTLTIGVRHNHAAAEDREFAKRERCGLDVFFLTPDMAATVPAMPLGMGRPVWDYWLPHHFRERGCRFRWINQPYFFHADHPVGWTPAEWVFAADWFRAHYGTSLVYGSPEFRRRLERGTKG